MESCWVFYGASILRPQNTLMLLIKACQSPQEQRWWVLSVITSSELQCGALWGRKGTLVVGQWGTGREEQGWEALGDRGTP